MNLSKLYVTEESTSPGFSDYMNLFTEGEPADAITKLAVITYGNAYDADEAEGENERLTAGTARTLSGGETPTDIHSWELLLEEYVDTFGEPDISGRLLAQLMIMMACTMKSLIDGDGIPVTCYDNAVADAAIAAEGELDERFDLFTWNGIGQAMFIACFYYATETTLVKMLEKTGFVMWYALDSSLDPGSAYFLWGGFDFIAGSTFAWFGDSAH
jgi:hypothetical protein